MSALPLPLLYEDDHLVAVDKPAWAVVHPTRGAIGAPVLVELLAAQLGQTLYVVHRLDRQTSGVLLLAKSPEVASLLGLALREGRVHKTYLGLCRGVICGTLRVDHPVPEGTARRPARTDFEPLQAYCERYSLIRAYPEGGRRHQIRYHLKHASHPLVCDSNYGKGPLNRFFREHFGLQRLFLHAERLRLDHPLEPRLLELQSPLPGELCQVLQALESYQGPVV